MEITQTKEQDIVVLAVNGRIGPKETKEFSDTVTSILNDGVSKILFDFDALEYINSAGLGVLVMAFQKTKAEGGQIGLCNIKYYIQEVIEVTGYDKIFAIFETRDQGVQGL